MIVDCHMHAWRYPEHFNKAALRLSIPPRKRRDEKSLDERFKEMWDAPIEKYLSEMREVDKSIILGIQSWDTLGIATSNDYLAEEAKKAPDRLSWCCCVNPVEENAAEEVERCVKDLGAIGIGELCPTYGNYHLNDERCSPVWEKAQELGMPVIVHAGPAFFKNAKISLGDVLAVDDLAINFPQLKIVICHMGAYKFEDTVFLTLKHENVFADISYLVGASGLERTRIPRYLPIVEFPYYHLLHPLLYYFTQVTGTADKLLWGTDFPITRPTANIQILSNINQWFKKYDLPEIPEQSIHNIFHENWKKVFPHLAEE